MSADEEGKMSRGGLGALCALVLLVAAPPAQSAGHVYPRAAQRLRPIELDRLIVLALPDRKTERPSWSYLHALRVLRWGVADFDQIDDGKRSALARVRVRGRTFLTKRAGRTEEIAWRVRLSAGGDPSLGPTSIEIRPADECFARSADSCVFPERDLSGPGIKSELMCSYGTAGNHGAAYFIRVRGKRDAVLVYSISTGSGGEAAWVDIEPFRLGADICTELKEGAL